MEQLNFSSEICAGKKRPLSDETTLAGGNSQKKKREKLVAQKSKAIEQPHPSLGNGEDKGGKDGNSADSSSDDASHEVPTEVEDRVQSVLEKKARITADRKNYWLEKKHEPISVRQGPSAKGKSVVHLGYNQYTLEVLPFARNVSIRVSLPHA